jgi:hypothetical protein
MGTNGRAGISGRGKAAQPVRKRRVVEADYLAVVADVVPPGRWRRIVDAAADLAEKGDAKSREWLARCLLGEAPPSLVSLAADAAEGSRLGDFGLLSQLLRARREAASFRIFDRMGYEDAQRVLASLARSDGGPADPEGPKEEGDPALPNLPAPPDGGLGMSG